MINLVKTNSENIDFINLIKKLDKNLHEINGEEQLLFNDFKIVSLSFLTKDAAKPTFAFGFTLESVKSSIFCNYSSL